MAKYMWTGSYTVEGTKGVIAEGGSSRKAAVEKMLASVGGKLVSVSSRLPRFPLDAGVFKRRRFASPVAASSRAETLRAG